MSENRTIILVGACLAVLSIVAIIAPGIFLT